jgi:ketosteroid isomerase-like protein
MSEENVEIVRAAFDAVNRQDFEAAFKDVAPGAQVDMSRAVGLIHGVFTIDQWRRTLSDLFETWESLHIETHEFIDAGERVIVPLTLHGRGRDGIEVATSPTFVWTVRDGVVQHVEMYQERQHALEAAGLRE